MEDFIEEQSDKQKIKSALMKKALGYDIDEKKVIADENGKPVKVEITKRHIPPDLSTASKILRDIDRDKW